MHYMGGFANEQKYVLNEGGVNAVESGFLSRVLTKLSLTKLSF